MFDLKRKQCISKGMVTLNTNLFLFMLDMLLPQMSLIFDASMRHVFFEWNEAWLGSSLIVLVSTWYTSLHWDA
jgi:hypothetical protein